MLFLRQNIINMIKLNIHDETSRLRAVVLGTAESVGPVPSIEEAYDPKSIENIKAGTYPTEADMVAEPVEFVVDAEGEGAEDVGDDLDIEIEDDEVPAMGMDSYNRDDLTEEDGAMGGDQSKTRRRKVDKDDKDPKADAKARKKYDKSHKGHGFRDGDQLEKDADFRESLDLEVVDDEALTEAVLKRVVERLLSRK